MKTRYSINIVRAALLAFSLILAPLAVRSLAQNTSQSGQATQSSGSASQTTRESTSTTQSQPATSSSQTTTTTTQSQPAQTTTQTSGSQATGIDPMWLIIGVVALLAILLIAILSMRGRSSGSDTVVERKTTVKRE